MKISLSAALVLALSSATVSASVITLPIKSYRNQEHLNAESLTKRYLERLERRAAPSFTTAPLTSIRQDIVYTVPLQLGTPPQDFNVLIDTGSPYTWVSSVECISAACLKSKRYSCSASSTCLASNTRFKAEYVDGDNVSGLYVAENYGIGSLKFRAIAAIATIHEARMPPTVDGIMGLWYYGAGSNIPILNVLKNDTVLTENVIGIWLQKAPSGSVTAPGGEITFGGVDSKRFTGSISYVDCIPGRPWTIPLSGLSVKGQSIPVPGVMAAIDTGSTAMLIPKSASDAIHANIPGAEQLINQGNIWVIPCSGNTPVTLTFGSFTADIPYSSLAMQSTRQMTSQGEYCLSAAMFPTGTTAVIEEWIIGDVFLNNVYSVYDFQNNAASGGRIGFAQLVSGGTGGGGGSDGSGRGGDGNGAGGDTGSGKDGKDGKDGKGSSAGNRVPILSVQASALILISAIFAML